jgi:hypothetical protein
MELLTGQMKTPFLISSTDMLFVNRAAMHQPPAPATRKKEQPTATPGSVEKAH